MQYGYKLLTNHTWFVLCYNAIPHVQNITPARHEYCTRHLLTWWLDQGSQSLARPYLQEARLNHLGLMNQQDVPLSRLVGPVQCRSVAPTNSALVHFHKPPIPASFEYSGDSPTLHRRF